jgi:aliphatic nitrilase
MSTIKVAAVQAAPAFLDRAASIAKACALIDQAGREKVDLLAFPETWIPGYPWWIWLDAPAFGMPFVARYHANALVAGGAEDEQLARAARRNQVTVSIGAAERDGGSLYMAQWLYGADGRVLARRRKLKPTHVERTLFGEGDGSDVTVVETPLGRIGSLCCWEHLQPLTKYAMYAQGEEIHIAAWPSFSLYLGAAYALGPELNTAASQMYAAEGQCFVVAACATVSPAMLELLCDSPAKRELLKAGGGYARIFAPDGRPLGTPLGPDAEGLVSAEIDLASIALAKSAADPVGHYARPDVLRLMFNASANPRVVAFEHNFAPAAQEQ